MLAEINRLPLRPHLVFVDTLNQNIDGDEDGAGMGGFVAGCSKIRDLLGAAVVIVHHTPLGADDRGRGHSAFDGALDTRIIVSRDDERLTLECTHQRNGVDGWSVNAEAIPIAKSLALKPSSPTGGKLSGQRRHALDVVSQLGPMTYSAWMKAAELKKPSFQKARGWLMAQAYVTEAGKKYMATDSGRMALGIRGIQEGYS